MGAILAERFAREGRAYSTYPNFGPGAHVETTNHPLKEACKAARTTKEKEGPAEEGKETTMSDGDEGTEGEVDRIMNWKAPEQTERREEEAIPKKRGSRRMDLRGKQFK